MKAQTFLPTHCSLLRNPYNLHGMSRRRHHHHQQQQHSRSISHVVTMVPVSCRPKLTSA